MNRTSIEWCRTYNPNGTFTEGHTVNPLRFRPHGSERTTTMCQKVSPGCANCYAAGITRRFWPKDANVPFPGYTAPGLQTGNFVLDESKLHAVLRHRKPTRLFWGDMTDNFQEGIPDVFLDKCFAVCALTPHITHMFLTKRPERMRYYIAERARNESTTGHRCPRWPHILNTADFTTRAGGPWEKHRGEVIALAARLQRKETGWPLPNVWCGTSVEDRKHGLPRIDVLRQVPAAVRFLSIEPLLEDLGKINLEGIHWVLIGGESGPGARRFNVEWMRSLIAQCKAAGVACFAKQLGSLPVEPTSTPGFTEKIVKLASAKGGDWNEWPADLRVRQFPEFTHAR